MEVKPIPLEKLIEEAINLGRREVVGRIKSHRLVEPDNNSITRFEPFYQIEQAELKSWGIK